MSANGRTEIDALRELALYFNYSPRFSSFSDVSFRRVTALASEAKSLRQGLAPALCPEGHPMQWDQFAGRQSHFLSCTGGDCSWTGPSRSTKAAALADWNDALAALNRAVQA